MYVLQSGRVNTTPTVSITIPNAGSIYVLGGNISPDNATNRVECYNLLDECWQPVPPMMTARICLSAVAAGGEAIAVCGGCGDYGDHSSCEIFSADTQRYVTHKTFCVLRSIRPIDQVYSSCMITLRPSLVSC